MAVTKMQVAKMQIDRTVTCDFSLIITKMSIGFRPQLVRCPPAAAKVANVVPVDRRPLAPENDRDMFGRPLVPGDERRYSPRNEYDKLARKPLEARLSEQQLPNLSWKTTYRKDGKCASVGRKADVVDDAFEEAEQDEDQIRSPRFVSSILVDPERKASSGKSVSLVSMYDFDSWNKVVRGSQTSEVCEGFQTPRSSASQLHTVALSRTPSSRFCQTPASRFVSPASSLRLKTPSGSNFQTPTSGFQSPESSIRFRTPRTPRTPKSKCQTPDSNFQTPNSRLYGSISPPKLQTPKPRLPPAHFEIFTPASVSVGQGGQHYYEIFTPAKSISVGQAAQRKILVLATAAKDHTPLSFAPSGLGDTEVRGSGDTEVPDLADYLIKLVSRVYLPALASRPPPSLLVCTPPTPAGHGQGVLLSSPTSALTPLSSNHHAQRGICIGNRP